MKALTFAFLKLFFRNKRAMFFVMILPAAMYLIIAFLRFEQIIQFSSGQDYADYLLPGIIAFAAMNMGIYTASYALIDLRKQMVLKRLAVTPLGADRFLFAQGLARSILAIVQTILLIIIAILVFETKFTAMIVLAPFVLLFGTVIFLNFGSIIASVAKDYEEAAPYTTIVGLSLSFFGDAFFPVSNLPDNMQRIAHYLPMEPFVSLLRFSFYAQKADMVWENIFILIIWLVASTFASKIIFSKKAYR